MSVAHFEGVTKSYGPVIGVNDVTLSLHPGVTGLLGPNGAGKTTLIKLLIGQLRPDIGKVSICGVPANSAAARRRFGYCPEADVCYDELSGRQFVLTMARLQGMSAQQSRDETERVLADVGMTERAERRLSGYSKGMRQRIKLAQALLHHPALLVVDEPLNGIDPVGRVTLMELFRRLGEQGVAVLVSSHILGEMDDLADRIVFMGRGRVLAVGGLSEIRDLFADQPLQVRVQTPEPRRLAAELIGWSQVLSVELGDSQTLQLQVVRADEFFARLQTAIVQSEITIDELEATDVTAEATFAYVMQASRRF